MDQSDDPAREYRTPQFIYFDLGNVLVNFDHQRAARQMAAVAGITPDQVWEVVFGGDLELRYERGDISAAEFHESFCQQTGSTPSLPALAEAASDIFELNRSVVSVLDQLQNKGHRLGLLSNTNDAHWSFVRTEFSELIPYFEVLALSFEMHCLKPEPQIYAEAARLAGLDPRTILFIDDRPENVTGAIRAGFDAIPFEGHQQLTKDLEVRNVF